jgi:hypothetical protein
MILSVLLQIEFSSREGSNYETTEQPKAEQFTSRHCRVSTPPRIMSLKIADKRPLMTKRQKPNFKSEKSHQIWEADRRQNKYSRFANNWEAAAEDRLIRLL